MKCSTLPRNRAAVRKGGECTGDSAAMQLPTADLQLILLQCVGEAISRHLHSCYPLEGCGALIGIHTAQAIRIVEAVPLTNKEPQSDFYVIDPLEYSALERRLDADNKGRGVDERS